jgi:hypothetical protein
MLGRLLAADVAIPQAIEAARQAAGLPYEMCHDGVQQSRPSRDGSFEYCGMRHEVQAGALAIAGYAEAMRASQPCSDTMAGQGPETVVVADAAILVDETV